jgi:hypothetical protein
LDNDGCEGITVVFYLVTVFGDNDSCRYWATTAQFPRAVMILGNDGTVSEGRDDFFENQFYYRYTLHLTTWHVTRDALLFHSFESNNDDGVVS